MRQKPALTNSDAHKMMAACIAEAQKNKWPVSIAIVDDSGAALLVDPLDAAQIGVQVTDSPYVAVSMRIMTRMGQKVLDHLGVAYRTPGSGGGCCGALHTHAGLIDSAEIGRAHV